MKVVELNAGPSETIADALEAMASDVRESTGEAKAVGYLALVVRADGGVDWRADGRELSILGALVYVRDRLCARWAERK